MKRKKSQSCFLPVSYTHLDVYKRQAEQLMNDQQLEAYQDFLAAKAYQAFAIKRRDSKNITSTLRESHPILEISPRDLDADPFALGTPEATFDLRKGMAGARAVSYTHLDVYKRQGRSS